jgi:DNA-binding NarL/FixJ family response regulator
VRQVTEKQKQIALLVRQGFSNARIAEALGNTEGAIEQHLVKLFKRLRVKTRDALGKRSSDLVVCDRRFRRGSKK